jgi:hypothetical protein
MSNKRFFSTVVVLVYLSSVVSAQEMAGEFSVGVGAFSARALSKENVWGSQRDGAGSSQVKTSGVYHLSYRFLKKERMSLGFLVTGELQKVTNTGAPMPEHAGKYSESRDRYLALLVDYRYHWGAKKHTSWYSGLAPGVAWGHSKVFHDDFGPMKTQSSKTRLAYQVTAVGLRVGRRLSGYVEMGYGYKGIFSVGANWAP